MLQKINFQNGLEDFMEAFDKLLDATRQVIAEGLGRVGGQIPELATLHELASAPPNVQPSRPGGLERTGGLLPTCVGFAHSDLDQQLAQALLDAAPHLHWASPYDEYGGGELMEPLRREYICTLLLGPSHSGAIEVPFATRGCSSRSACKAQGFTTRRIRT